MQKEASKFSVASKVLSYSNLYKSVIFCMKECGQTKPTKKTLDPSAHTKVPNMAKVIYIYNDSLINTDLITVIYKFAYMKGKQNTKSMNSLFRNNYFKNVFLYNLYINIV